VNVAAGCVRAGRGTAEARHDADLLHLRHGQRN
jgi:hypothetical protein